MDSARNRLQSVKEQLERTQNDLKETLEIKAELEGSGDAEFLEEVKGSESRQRALIAELETEIGKLQKPSGGAEAMRARLAAIRDREAQARSVLKSGELPAEIPSQAQAAPLIPTLPPVSNAPASIGTSERGLISPRDSLAASQASTTTTGQGGKNATKRPITSQQEDKLIGEFGNLGNGNSNQGFGAGAFDKKPFNLANAPSATSQISNATSIVNNPPKSTSDFSLESFGDNAFGGPPSTKSTIKSSASSPHAQQLNAPDSAFRRSDGSGSIKSVPKDDFGFGETVFPSNSGAGFDQPTFKQWSSNPPSGPAKSQAPLAEHGRGVSLKDSFPTSQAPKSTAQGSSSQWQAFDLSPQNLQPQSTPGFQSASSGGLPGFSQPAFPGLQGAPSGHSQGIQGTSSGGLIGSDFGSGTFSNPAQRANPAPKSGNPFMDADEPGENESPYTNPAAYSWGGSAAPTRRSTDSVSDYGQPGHSGFAGGLPKPSPAFSTGPGQQQNSGFSNFQEPIMPKGSVDYDPFGPLPQSQPQSQPQSARQPQSSGFGFGEDTFPSSFTSQAGPGSQAGSEVHNGRFGHPGQPYLVTPSAVVIPDSDWDAAFSQAAPKAPTQAAPSVEEDAIDLSVWTPMGEADRAKVRAAYEDRYKAQLTNGISREDAMELYNRGSLKQSFERIFSLADMDGDSKLNFPEFLVFMHSLRLLNQKKDAVVLPNRFSHKSASSIIGVDYASLPRLVEESSGFDNDDIGFNPPSRAEMPSQSAASTGPDQKVRTLVSRGSNEEDAKRALFLNGDDLDAAQDWLQTRKSSPTKDPGNIPGSLSTLPEEDGPTQSIPEGPAGPRISLRIDKALLNYKKPVEKPCFAITVINSWGEPVGDSQQTPPGTYDSNSGTVTFGHTIVLPDGIHKISDDSCIYFELKHFKVKEKKWSTLGWTYRHKQNFVKVVDGVKCVRTEAQGLNLYEKPINFSSHFKQSAMRKMKPLSGSSPDFYLRVAEAS